MSDAVYIEVIRAFGPVTVALVGIVGIWLQTRKTHAKVQSVESEMRPNGGSTIRDSLNRIEQRLDRHLEDCAQGRRRR